MMLKSSIIIIYLLLPALINITSQQTTGAKDVLKDQKMWFEDGNGLFKWSFGCSFPKGGFFALDVNQIKKNQSSACPSLCYEDSRCTHFIYKNGHCHLKMFRFVDASPKVAIYNNPGGLCGFIVERPDVKKNWIVGDSGRTRWSTECDYPNAKFNIYSENNFLMFNQSKCSAHCLSVKRCTHFGWKMGTCLVKDISGAPIVQVVDKTIPLCGFIPERQYVVKQRTASKTTVASPRNNSVTKLTTKSNPAGYIQINNQRHKFLAATKTWIERPFEK